MARALIHAAWFASVALSVTKAGAAMVMPGKVPFSTFFHGECSCRIRLSSPALKKPLKKSGFFAFNPIFFAITPP